MFKSMPKELLTKEDIDRAITRMTHEIIEKNKGTEDLYLIGIQRGGVFIAKRISSKISLFEKTDLSVGTLDISMYRDDLGLKEEHPVVRKTDIPFDVTGKKIILVDDVLFTGRSIRAAMDALFDIGRPALIQLAVLIDRGHRELPIKADYVGKNIPTALGESVEVQLKEDGIEDKVFLFKQVNERTE